MDPGQFITLIVMLALSLAGSAGLWWRMGSIQTDVSNIKKGCIDEKDAATKLGNRVDRSEQRISFIEGKLNGSSEEHTKKLEMGT